MDQSTLIIFGLFIAAILTLQEVVKSKKRKRKKSETKTENKTVWPAEHFKEELDEPKEFDCLYKKNRYLLSKAELSFAKVLESAIDETVRIITKVRIADVLEPESNLNFSERQSAFNRISRKHFDFVIVKAETYEILNAIELDDASHERMDRIERDDFVDKACKQAGLKLIRVRASRTYSVNEIRELILGSKDAPKIEKTHTEEQQDINQSPQLVEEVTPEVPTCSKC